METAYLEAEKRVDNVREKYALVEGWFDASEATSPWIPYLSGIWLRHLSFDIRRNVSVHIMRADSGGCLGRHRHRAQVTGYVLKGSLRYAEYDWVARENHFFHESPGRVHTLYSDNGMETLFHLGTPVEFLDEDDRIIQIVDVFWMIEHYESYCRKHGLTINKALYV